MYLMLHACWFLDCPYAVHKLCVLALLKPFCWKEPNLPRHLDCSVGLFPSCLTTVLSLSSQLVERSEVLPMLSVQVAQLPTCPQPEQPQPSFPGLWAAVLAAVGAQSPLHSLALLRPWLYLQHGAQSGNFIFTTSIFTTYVQCPFNLLKGSAMHFYQHSALLTKRNFELITSWEFLALSSHPILLSGAGQSWDILFHGKGLNVWKCLFFPLIYEVKTVYLQNLHEIEKARNLGIFISVSIHGGNSLIN